MKRLSERIEQSENLVAYAAVLGMLGCVLWGVMTRYITERPAVWTSELSGILFTWVVFIGALGCQRKGLHIRVTLLLDLLPPPATKALVLLANLVTLGFLLAAAWFSFVMLEKGASRHSPVLNIPFAWVYLAPLLGFGGMSIIAFLRLIGVMAPPSQTPEDML